MDDKRITEVWKDFQSLFSPGQSLADQPWFERLGGLIRRKKLRGKWPVVLELLKEKYPPADHPNGLPDPAFAPRQSLVMWLRELDPSRLGSLDEATLDKAIAAYDREIRNSSE
jgi:hypothetical protein